MLVFNPKFCIDDNSIYRKDYKVCYELPKELMSYIKINKNNINSNCFDKNILNFLLSKEIVVSGTLEYNPFINTEFCNSDYRLFIQLTENCNLRCKHCYIGIPDKTVDYFNLERAKSLVYEAVKIGIYRIDFTGGEVFLLDYFFELLDYIEQFPIIVTIFTNLTLLSKDDLLKLSSYNCVSRIITSLDYFNENLHDEFRGHKGAFSQTLNSILLLRKCGVSVTVNTMILKNNRNDITLMLKYFKKYGVDVHLDRVIIRGNAVTNYKIFVDENENFDDIEFISKYIIESNKVDEMENNLRRNNCGVGKTLLFVDKFGRFQLCTGLTEKIDKKYFMGLNIYDAINNISRYDIKCNNFSCKYHKECSYGCRERALFESGSDESPDFGVCKLIEILQKSRVRNNV